MNDDRKFQLVADDLKALLENNIPIKVIAEVMQISTFTVNNYKKKVEKRFGITFTSSKNKKNLYGDILLLYAKNYGNRKTNYKLQKSLDLIIDTTIIDNAIMGISRFMIDLRFPKTEKNFDSNFQAYLIFLEKIIGSSTLGFDNYNWCGYHLEKSIKESVMIAVANGDADLSKVKNIKDFIPIMSKIISNAMDRETITSLTLDEKKVIEDINEALNTVTERQREILKYYFGLDRKKLSLQEIGNEFGMTRERARQIMENALKRLEHPSRFNMLTSCIKSQERIKQLEEALLKINEEFNIPSKEFDDEQTKFLNTNFEHMDISVRCMNALNNVKIVYPNQLFLFSKRELLLLKIGKKSIEGLEQLFANNQIDLDKNLKR